jgi:phosphatidylglycerol lysyltransferase
LTKKGGAEKGFSMGRFDIHRDDKEQLYALAVDATNKVHAFVSFVPIYGRNGWGLDLMRRGEDAAPGTIELLLAHSIDYLKAAGADIVSLGLAPLSNANQTEATLLGNSIDFLNQQFGDHEKNSSLFNFKKKFHPTWESRYLIFSHTLTLPKVGWAIYHAHQRDASLFDVLYKGLKDWLVVRPAQKRSAVLAEMTGHVATGGVQG